MCKNCTAISFFIITLFLVACEEVNFLQSQPVGVDAIDEFPEELRGHYVSTDNDTLHVENRALRLYNRSNPCEKLSEQDSLNELVRLTKMGKNYFLNINEHGQWSVLLIDVETDNSIIVSMISSEEENALKAVEQSTEIDYQKDEDGEVISYTINPSRNELQELISNGLFTTISELRKIDNH